MARGDVKDATRGTARPRPLSRERVLKAGLGILDRDGQAGLTLRRLAKQLGVSPMALYNHVRDKSDLFYGIAELVIDGVQYQSDSDDWREQIRACFRELRRACLAHPGVVGLVETADVLPVSVFRPMEITVAALRRTGLGPRDSLAAFFLLMNFTMGQVAYQIRGPFRGVDPAWASRHGRLSAAAFPASAAAVQAVSLGDWDFDAAYEFGLSAILAGLADLARDDRGAAP